MPVQVDIISLRPEQWSVFNCDGKRHQHLL